MTAGHRYLSGALRQQGEQGAHHGRSQQDLHADRRCRSHRARHRRARAQALGAHRRLRNGGRDQRLRSAWRAFTCARRTRTSTPCLARIQNDLFDLGADLTMPERGEGAKRAASALRVSDAQVKRLEDEIDATERRAWRRCGPSCSPGGSAAAAALHVARTVCRRAERGMVELAGLARRARRARRRSSTSIVCPIICSWPAATSTTRGEGDVLWVPGQNR